MGLLSSFFHPDRGYKSAADTLQNYFNQSGTYYQPLINEGQSAYGDLSSAMKALLDPAALENQWAQSYTESPYAKQVESEATSRGLNAASSLGLMGSSPALQAIQGGTSAIVNEDRQNFLNDLMQKYLAGTGIAQNIFNTGAQASGQMGQNTLNMGEDMAKLMYGQQNAQGSLFGKLLGLGGGLLAGPLGGALANKMGWSTTGTYGS